MSKRTYAIGALVITVAAIAGLLGLIYNAKYQPSPKTTGFIEVTRDNFATEVLQSQQPVFILFYVPDNCQPCDQQQEMLDQVAPDYAGRVKFVRINAATQHEIVQANGVTVVPTSFIVRPADGIGFYAEGLMDEESLRQFIEEGLAHLQP